MHGKGKLPGRTHLKKIRQRDQHDEQLDQFFNAHSRIIERDAPDPRLPLECRDYKWSPLGQESSSQSFDMLVLRPVSDNQGDDDFRDGEQELVIFGQRFWVVDLYADIRINGEETGNTDSVKDACIDQRCSTSLPSGNSKQEGELPFIDGEKRWDVVSGAGSELVGDVLDGFHQDLQEIRADQVSEEVVGLVARCEGGKGVEQHKGRDTARGRSAIGVVADGFEDFRPGVFDRVKSVTLDGGVSGCGA